MPGEKILIVEDDKDLTKLLTYNLQNAGYRVVSAHNGETGLNLFEKERPDLILLDVMMPKMDGLEFCRIVRSRSKIPVVMLTAKVEEMDRVLGLELGADDYVTKPFSIRELLARVKAILRRFSGPLDEKVLIRFGQLEVDLERYEVRLGEKPVHLSSKEFEFLRLLIESHGKVLTRDQILEKVWGYEDAMEIDTRTVDQHIARLREKLAGEAHRILTIKNVGYRFKTDE